MSTLWEEPPFDWRERIVLDLAVLAGKPVIAGTRISVELVVSLLAAGWTREQILASYPPLTSLDVQACLAYASALLHSEQVLPWP